MNSRKFNIFSFVMVAVMCVFTICVAFTFKGEDGTDGTDGKSAYELAVENGYTGTEVEYLMSLQGEDGSSITLDDLYEAYLSVYGKEKTDQSYVDFITTYFDEIVDVVDSTTATQLATQVALRSTVDICYSYYYDNIIYGYKSGTSFYASSFEEYYDYGVAAGSGVIYQFVDSDGDDIDDTAYIITNYHVLYVDYYISEELENEGYRVFYDYYTGEFFTAKYDETMNNGTYTSGGSMFNRTTYTIVDLSSTEYADYLENFLDEYSVYVYGYQSSGYAISATYVGGSADNDIAVLKVERNSDNTNNEILFNGSYTEVTVGDSSTMSVGTEVVAVGNPLLADTSSISSSSYSSQEAYVKAIEDAYVDALCLTSTSGVVSNLSEYCTMSSIVDSSSTITLRLIRVDAAINAGNSGGGLYDLSGRLIGIVNAKIVDEEYDNVGYAIPINIAARIADQIISQCNGTTVSQISVITENSLGLSVTQGESSSYFNNTRWILKNNVVVESITSGGLADEAGLSVGDVILSIQIGDVIYVGDYDTYVSQSSNVTVKAMTNYYDFVDILLEIPYESGSDYTITIVYQTSTGLNSTEEKEITITVSNSDFVTLT